jgi:hypothetical protein
MRPGGPLRGASLPAARRKGFRAERFVRLVVRIDGGSLDKVFLNSAEDCPLVEPDPATNSG